MKQSKQDLLKFYFRCLLLALPLLALVILYIIKDPFMVLYHYDDYDHSHIMQNEGAIGWEKFIDARSQQHYDSFILGTSCTKAFSCHEWNKYIHAHPFRLFSNAEGLGDMYLKLKAINAFKDAPVKHLLIVTERSFFEKTVAQSGIMHVMPPTLSGKSMLSYQTTYFQGFLSPSFLLPYANYMLTGRIGESGENVINAHIPVREKVTNDAVLWQEQTIATDRENYWKQTSLLPMREKASMKTAPRAIGKQQIDILLSIRDFCRRHHTDIQWVIGPRYHQERLNPHDVSILQQIFGKEAVHDYSTSKRWEDYHYWYDSDHYRKLVGNDILHDIYAGKKKY